MQRSSWIVCVLTALAVVGAALGNRGVETAHVAPGTAETGAHSPDAPRTVATATLGVHFEENRGQDEQRVAFVRRGADHVTFLTADGFSTSMVVERAADGASRMAAHRMRLVGSDPRAEVIGERPLPGRVNHLKGNDPDAWITGVPTYGAVRLRNVYPGVDLVHHGEHQLHEYDFVVAPGADPRPIEMVFEGVDDLRLDDNGDLVITDAGREIRHTRPVVYQDTPGGRVALAASFRTDGDRHVGFRLEAHDPELPLVIDPGIAYSTYLGGTGSDYMAAIAVNDEGHAHIGGQTTSADFPLASALDGTLAGSRDGVLVKLSVTGSSLIYSTYVGGADEDQVFDIAVAVDGGVIAVGSTRSDDFPVVAQSATGEIYVAGTTFSQNLPTTQGVVHPNQLGGQDAFVARLSAAGTSFEYVTYVGGSAAEGAQTDVFVDDEGRAYLSGITDSTDLPTRVGALQVQHRGGGTDGFVGRLAADGSAWDWMTYVGGSGADATCVIAPGPSGNIWSALETASTDMLTSEAIQQTHAGGVNDLYLMLLNSRGDSILSGTYLGGSGRERLSGLAADPTGGAWLTGTAGSDFPTVAPLASSGSGVLVAKVDSLGKTLEFATLFGSSGFETDLGNDLIATDAAGEAYVLGHTSGSDLPTAGPPFQSQPRVEGLSPFVAKLGEALLPPTPTTPVIDDTELYVVKSKFKINRTKHGRGTAADVLIVKGVLNPRGIRDDLAGATMTVTVGGEQLVSGQFDSRGRAKSAAGASPKFKLRLKAKKGAFQCKLGGLDLRTALGIADTNERGTARADIAFTIEGAGLATETVQGELEFASKSRLGKSSSGKFAFKKHASVDGVFKTLKTSVRERSGGGHTVGIRGPLVTLETEALTFPGDIRITIGDGATVTVPHASLRTAGTPGRTSTTSYSRSLGEVVAISRLSYSNRKRTLTLTTAEIAGLGIPAAGPGAPMTHELPIAIEIDTDSDPVRFETIVELHRSSPTSTKWAP